ncbi:MAG: ABC transporter permease [Bacillota bacterium]
MRRHLALLAAEFARGWAIMKRYWANELSFAITVYLIFLMMVFMGGAMAGQAVPNELKASALVGILVWQLSMGCLGVLGWSYFNEAATGTLEHLYLSPLGVTRVFLARSVVDFFRQLLVMAFSATLAMVTMGITLKLPLPELAVILPLAVAGMYGWGFMLAALTLTVKRTQNVMQLLQFFFLFFSGSVMPLEQMHWTIRYFGQTLPISAGIVALRKVTIEGARLGELGDLLVQMAATSVLWLVIGVAIYTLADRRARLKGSIGQY